MSNVKQNQSESKQSLLLAIAAAGIVLVLLIVLTVALSGNGNTADNQNMDNSTQPSAPVNSTPTTPLGEDGDLTPNGDSQTSGSNEPTESAPMVLEQGLYIVRMGNFSGRYVEDGSDAQVENFCSVIVENRSTRTLQLLQFKVIDGDRVYEFRLTTLPPGERAVVQELSRTTFVPGEALMRADVELCVFFDKEPSLHEDVFAISGTENGIELRNLTDKEISGPIYVYYKTRTADGFGGGITYRVTVPGLAAKGVYKASVSHFWPGSSQVMFIDYAQ